MKIEAAGTPGSAPERREADVSGMPRPRGRPHGRGAERDEHDERDDLHHRKGQLGSISDEWAARIIEWNRTLDPRGRYEAVMKAEALFAVEPIP